MAVSLTKAKALCTASELTLVTASGKERIGSLSMPQLRLKVTQARKLRDKWRDQAAKQTRTSQAKQRGRQVVGNARSADKAKLFADVLRRFEAELAKPKAERGNAKRARKAAPLKVKEAGHRAERAEIRGALKEKKLQLKSEASKNLEAGAPPAVPPHVAKGAPSSAAESKAMQMPVKTKPAPAKSSKANRVAKVDSAKMTAGASLQVSKRQQLKARSQAKQTRLKAAGVVRIQKHVSAQNKRRQAKRDSR
jgi:hypothetical protein